MEHQITRFHFTDFSTIGRWKIENKFQCFTLEDKVREPEDGLVSVGGWKIPGETAIPRGRYKLEISFSNHFQRDLPILISVPGFSGVRVHSGNTAADTEGCIIVGNLYTANSVTHSRDAFAELFEIIKNGGPDQWLSVK